jgi:DNA-binding CsgD family transcriptional regulator
MEFDVTDADYYNQPMEKMRKNYDLPLSKAYYWSDLMILPGTSEEVVLCTVPLMDSKKNIYGVCGFEISDMLFKLSHMPSNNVYSRMFCMLSPLEDSYLPVGHSLIAGGYSVKDISKEITKLQIKESKSSFTTYTGPGDTVFVGYHSNVQLYPEGSPFNDRKWITALLVPKEDVVDSIMQLNIILACLLSLLVTGGIIISIVFSNKYLKPISQGIEIIKSIEAEEAPKTKVQEIDDLIVYLSQYKKNLSKKVEQDKYKISILEEFVKKTKTLTPAENSVFSCYIRGLSSKETAGELFLSINTIKTHSKHIFAKLEVATREELLLYINMLKEIGVELK